MAVPRISIYHRVLDRRVDVPASTVHIWERAGWTSDRLAEIVKLSEDAGLYDDLDPITSGDPIASRPADVPAPPGDTTTPSQED